MEIQDTKQKVIIAITKSNFGGAQKYVYTLAKALQNKGFLVKILLGGDGILINKLKEENIEIIKLKSLQRDISITKEFSVFFEILKILKEKPDVLHLNSSKISGLGSLAGRLANIHKIIFTAHGFAFNENRNQISKIAFKFFYWLTFILAHKTIFVSKRTKEQAPKFLLPDSKFEIIYNGIAPINFIEKTEAKNLLSQKNTLLDPNKRWIGTLAELHHIKGIDILIDSAQEILKERDDIQFIVFGEGEEKSNLINKCTDINKNFILFGQLEDASKYLKSLDLLILPSRSEAMPLVILEAMQAQIPIIASNVGGISEMISKNSLFENKNIDQLTQKIKEKINNTNIEKYNLENFSLEQMVYKTIETYN